MGDPAGGRPVNHALLLPRLETLRLGYRARILDPLDHLGHGHEVHVVVVRQHLVYPVEERVQELGIVLEPGGVEVEAEGGPVLLVMAVEVVVEEVVELVTGQDVAARVDHRAAGQVLVGFGDPRGGPARSSPSPKRRATCATRTNATIRFTIHISFIFLFLLFFSIFYFSLFESIFLHEELTFVLEAKF